MAIREMRSLWLTIQNLSPEWQRDLLLDEIPKLVAKYGDVAAEAAAEWYEETRNRQIGGDYYAQLGDTQPETDIVAAIRSQAGSLFEGNPAQMAMFLEGALDRWVKYAGRSTIVNNVIRDTSKPRWARVPRGEKTCAWCSILASQGFFYLSKESAEHIKGTTDAYHNHCDCEGVPMWDASGEIIEGYDPDRMYDEYADARDMLAEKRIPDDWYADMRSKGINTEGAYDPYALAYLMRRLHPDLYSDGVKTD